jgi:hypothetical protein
MYWLIEDIKHIETICQIKHSEVYVDVIPCSHNLHPVENSVCAIYFKPLKDTKGYIIAINHSETINFELEEIERVLNSFGKIYVRDRKEFFTLLPDQKQLPPIPVPIYVYTSINTSSPPIV